MVDYTVIGRVLAYRTYKKRDQMRVFYHQHAIFSILQLYLIQHVYYVVHVIHVEFVHIRNLCTVYAKCFSYVWNCSDIHIAHTGLR